MNDETKQLIQSTILNYINKEPILEPKELDWEELILEAETSWENELLNEFGLNDLLEKEKREFLKDYVEEWKKSFFEEETYFEPDDSDPHDEELSNIIFESENVTIEVNSFLSWLKSQEVNPFLLKKHTLKIVLNFSPFELKEKIISIFKKQNINICDDKSDRISSFIWNCFEWDTKKYNKFKNPKTESINFLGKESLSNIFFYIIALNKEYKVGNTGTTRIKKIKFTSLANILRNDLKNLNKINIGLGTHLRSKKVKKIDIILNNLN